MKAGGIVLSNTSLIGTMVSTPTTLAVGMQGVLVCSTGAGLDPAITALSVNLRMAGASGSGYVVAHSSKVLTSQSMVGPFYFPAGEYVVITLGGSSITSAYIGLFPTT